MANLTVSAQFLRLMTDEITEAFERDVPAYESGMIKKLFNFKKTDKLFDEFFGVEAIGDIPKFNGTLPYLSPSPGYYTKIEQEKYGAIIQFERELLDLKRFDVFGDRAGDLARALVRTKEKKAARQFANSFSAAFDFMSSEEGVALCSTAHLTKVPGVSTTALGGFSNSGTTALSKTSIAAARLAGKRFRIGNGELADINLDTVLVPSSLYDTACEAVGYDPRSGAESELDPNSANHMINRSRGIKVVEWNLLDDTSTANWWMFDSMLMKKWLMWLESLNYEVESRNDFNTKAVETSIYARFATGFRDWRFIYGNNVS
jgi:hypothetical protein